MQNRGANRSNSDEVRQGGRGFPPGLCGRSRSHRDLRHLSVSGVCQACLIDADGTGGEPVETLRRLSPVVEETFIRRIAAPADAVIAEVTGPLAGSFYQADKGIKNCENAVRDGGLIVLVAACPDGIGQGAFTELLRRGATHGEVAGGVAARGYRLGDHKAVRLRRLTDPACRGVRVCVVSDGLSTGDAALLGLVKAPSVAIALRDASIDPAGATVIHLPDAGNTCLLLADD